ncbi:DUF6090 family protein [Aegicerativicinus sediminis]|uniref:DUF6090 family protein n=1 Tax=Aegicerativicinus sediminis TaxID=2893202 RepID=UPI001E4BA338|nr:DUF6090 family protein [Aegicerativicinus sediminis]
MRTLRNLRKSMLNNENARRYMVYAIGEIILVVIGILLALQFNNWAVEVKNQKEEQFYLTKLQHNLAQDTLYLRNRLNTLQFTDKVLDTVKAEIFNRDLDSFSNPSTGLAMVGVYKFSPQTSTFDNLLSTGKLELIRNQSLVDSIFTYYNDLKNFTLQRNESLETYTRETIGPYLLKQPGGIFSMKKIPDSYRSDPFFINALEFRKISISALTDDYKDVLSRSINLISLISNELKN